MRKAMYLVIPLLLSGGCCDTAVLPDDMSGQIRFGIECCGGEGFSTKAGIASESSLKERGFNASCCRQEDNEEIFGNLPACWDPELSSFCTGALWGDDRCSFAAVYPPSLSLSFSDASWNIGIGSTARPWDGDTDIMAAACYGQTRTYDTISLTFTHILACLDGFTAVPDQNGNDICINVCSVTVSGPAHGTYSIPSSPVRPGSWTSGGSMTFQFHEGCPIMLIPAPEGYMFNVSYTVSCDGRFYRELTASARIILPQGQRSTVQAILPVKGGRMQFSVSAAGWDEGESYDTIL